MAESSHNVYSLGQTWHIERSKVKVLAEVGRGSFGVVNEGVYNGEKVAVKRLQANVPLRLPVEKERAKFRKEIDLLHNSRHPNIVPLIGAYVGGDPLRWAMVLEFQDGGSLGLYLSEQKKGPGGLPIQVVHSMALDIARGMKSLHQKGIIHRDLKSDNLLLDRNGTVKIADFGLARYKAQDARDLTTPVGTIEWMAPEMIRGEPYTESIDVYSYGIVLWEICKCQKPYQDKSVEDIIDAVTNKHERPDTSGAPPALVNLMIRCWDKDAKRRPNFSKIVSHLENLITSGDTKDQSGTKQSKSGKKKSVTVDASTHATTSGREGRSSNEKPHVEESTTSTTQRRPRRPHCRCSMM